MRLQVRVHDLQVSADLREVAERRLRFALDRFSRRIRSVTTKLADLNGPRGGVDKACRIVVELIPSGRIFIEDQDTDLITAVSRAAERAGHAISRRLCRAPRFVKPVPLPEV